MSARDVPPRLAARRDPLTAAQAELVRTHRQLAEKLASCTMRRARLLSFEDLVSLGHQGLVDAAQTYDSSWGIAFEGHAWPRVHGAMKNALQRERMYWKLIKAAEAAAHEYSEVQADEGDPFDSDEKAHERFDRAMQGAAAALLVGFLATKDLTPEEQAMLKQAYEKALSVLEQALASMAERDRQVIELHYRERLDLKVVAERLGVSYISARRYHHGAMQRLGSRLKARGVTESPRV